MKLESIRHNWHENAGMRLNRPDGSGDYVLLHFLSPVILWYNGQKQEVPSGSLIVFSPRMGHGFYSEGPLLHDWMHLTGAVEEALSEVGLKTDTLYHMSQSLQITERIARLEAEFFAQNTQWERCIETLLSPSGVRLHIAACFAGNGGPSARTASSDDSASRMAVDE